MPRYILYLIPGSWQSCHRNPSTSWCASPALQTLSKAFWKST